MSTWLLRVAAVSAAVSVILLPLLLIPRWRRRYAPNTRRAVWLVIAAVLLAAPLLPKSQAPVQIAVPVQTSVAAAGTGTVTPAAPSAQTSLPVQPELIVPEREADVPQGSAPRTLNWGALAGAVWLVGALVVLVWHGGRFLAARRRLLRSAVERTDHQELAVQVCPGRRVRFFQAEGLATPMTLGILRPVVLLPRGFSGQAAVRHELIHVRRWDVAWKGVLLLSCAVHWFNPLVWLMSRQADRDMEAGCDALVVAGADAAERRAYGELLLQTAAGQNVPLATRFGGGKKQMKARLYDLFHPGKRSRLLVGMVLLLSLLAGSLVACRSGGDMTADTAVQALEDSITVQDSGISFTIPENYSPAENWNIHIAGRAEADGLDGISLHYLDGEQWEAGKTYTLDITQEQWADIIELTMDIALGEVSRSIDLLAADLLATAGRDGDADAADDPSPAVVDGQAADGIYCAPMPQFPEKDGAYDWERLELTLYAYDLERGEQGAFLGMAALPLAEGLTLQGLNDGSPRAAGELGSDARRRQIVSFVNWPLLRASAPAGLEDWVEVQVQDGAVTSLRWLQITSDDGEALPEEWMDARVVHPITGEIS